MSRRRLYSSRRQIGWLLTMVLRFLLLTLALYSGYTGNLLLFLSAMVTTGLSFLPSLFEERLKLPLKSGLLVTLLLFNHVFLGMGLNLHERAPHYDKFLHFFGTAIIAFIVFKMIFIQSGENGLRQGPYLIGLLLIVFPFTLGGLWEIFEFSIDNFTSITAQNGLCDTMCDHTFNLLGSIAVAAGSYIHLKQLTVAGYQLTVEDKKIS